MMNESIKYLRLYDGTTPIGRANSAHIGIIDSVTHIQSTDFDFDSNAPKNLRLYLAKFTNDAGNEMFLDGCFIHYAHQGSVHIASNYKAKKK